MEERFELVEDYELEPVPQSKRKGWVRLSFVWMGGIVALSAIVLGEPLVQECQCLRLFLLHWLVRLF